MSFKQGVRRVLRSFGYDITRSIPDDPVLRVPPSPLARQLLAWGGGVSSEVAFWSEWFATKGGDWPAEYTRRFDPATPFDASLIEGIDLDRRPPRVLDVGAGPATVLGKVHEGRPVDIVAVDPLAPFYAAIIRDHGAAPPIETRQCFGEALTAQFAADTFDLAYCRNALDHALDALACIEEMLIVTRVHGRVVLEHFENEAETQEYEGLHRWNFSEEDGAFVVWDGETHVNVTERYASAARITAERIEHGEGAPDTIIVRMDKTGPVGGDLEQRLRLRISDVLSAALLVSTARAGSG